MTGLKILVVDDEPELRKSVISVLRTRDYQIDEAGDGLRALDKIKSSFYNLVILDVRMPGMDGLTVLKKIKEEYPEIIVVILTAHANIRDAIEAIKEGAYNYLEKPIDQEGILQLVDKAIDAHQMIANVAFSAPSTLIQLDEGEEFIGKSQKMRRIFGLIDRLAKVNTTVLIRGENGTGKELVARAIHYNSPRKDKPFVAVNCGAVPENLIESEFFGHEKGAFTGAVSRKIGKFQYAAGGTLFLDEIGDISLQMQVKLLRVIQEMKFNPVGSNREIRTDVRLIAATNRDLETMIQQDTFREDFFYRLNVMPIYLPPLKERLVDLPELINHFIAKFNKLHGRSIEGVTETTIGIFKRYKWPGNIRELENVIEHAFVIEAGKKITPDSLPEHMHSHGTEDEGSLVADIREFDYHKVKEKLEREFIIQALKMCRGKINATVEAAKIPKNTLLRKIKKYNIHPKDYE